MNRISINRHGLLLLAALLAGLAAAWAARRYIQDHIRALDEQAKVKTVPRIVANYDLPEGLRIERVHLAVRDVPLDWVPAGSFRPEDAGSIENKVVTSSLKKGDILLKAHLTAVHRKAFSQKVRAGRRAITIPVDAINSVSGLLVPGDLIDLYVSFEYRRKKITAPLLQGVLVLATGAESQTQDSDHSSLSMPGYSTVTLDTSPEEAARLVAARQSGTITALLRHPDDIKASNKGVQGDLATILGIASAPAVARHRPVIIYGDQGSQRAGAAPQETKPVSPPPARGVFELPEAEDIVSAWISSLRSANTGASLSSAVKDPQENQPVPDQRQQESSSAE